jgi:hypothetical protein
MLPYGYETQRNNVLSPSTSLERHRLLSYLNEETDFFQHQKKVLHFAPEQALQIVSKQNLDYTTTDLFSQQM